MNKNIISNTLDNSVKIYIIPDNLIDYDYIIKFNNYGSCLDKHLKIYGFQHLLEHAIFYNYNNLNMSSNASTSSTYMTINFDIPHKNFNLLQLLNYWIFKDNNLHEINLSRNLSDEKIINYIHELNSESEFRSLLNISWDLSSFLLTNGKIHYFGGNDITLENKINEIKKNLLNPIKIPPKDIIIFIKNSKSNLYKETKNIFSQIKPLNNNITISYDEKLFYNKAIYINQGNTNNIIFLHFKKNFTDITLLYIINILYPFFEIIYNDILDAYYVYFTFDNINDLYTFYSILKSKNFNELYLNDINTNIKYNLSILNIDKIINIPEILSNNITYSSLFNKYKQKIINYFNLLSDLINKKQFFLNLTKQYMFNNITPITKEKYYMSNTNFLEDYFYSYYINNFKIINYLKKNHISKIIYCKCLSDVSKNLFFKKDKENNIYFVKYSTKISFSVYIQALLYYFINFYSETLEENIKNILNNNYKYLYKSNSNHEIILTNKIFKIKTQYDFFFSIFKIYKNETKNIYHTIVNLQDYLKYNGICYYIDYGVFNFKKFNIFFISTTINNDTFKKLYNNIINFLKSNNYKINGDVVFSYKSLHIDFSELNSKSIKCTI